MAELTKFIRIYSPEQEYKIKDEFSQLKEICYLDHAGATLYSRNQIQDNFAELTSNIYANPHSGNLLGKYTEDVIDVVRYRILKHFNTTSEEYSVIFTSGATGAIKIIAEHFNYGRKGTLMYLNDNHTSVLGMRGLAPTSREIPTSQAWENLAIFDKNNSRTYDSNSLFVYPAQSNFNGTKYPHSWIKNVQRGCLNHISKNKSNWFVLLDAASFVPTSNLNLEKYQPDFVPVSFCKMFGYPTGLGALLVKNSSTNVLKKKYFGGGTVEMILSSENVVVPRRTLHERFEDGTLPFLSIASLKHGFDTLRRLNLSMEDISAHTFSLAKYAYYNLAKLHHPNGAPLVVLYHSTKFDSKDHQGGVVNFNLLRDNGEYIGYAEVQHFANLYNIQLRTGCHCNPGACQYFLKLLPEEVRKHYNAGHVCGDQLDLVAGRPTGTVRVSFGYMSTKADADRLLCMLEECFAGFRSRSSREYQSGVVGASRASGILEKVFIYPVKSCAAFEVKGWWGIAATGLMYDRQWMIVNSSGVCVSQKQNRKLCLVQPTINLENNLLKLHFEDIRDYVDIPLDQGIGPIESNLCQSKVCGDKILGFDCGEDVAQWLSKKLDTPGLRLLRQCSATSRNSKKGDILNLSLANKAQYLLINRASVEWLINKIAPNELDEDLSSVIGRFRPNFVVHFSEAFAENSLNKMFIENLKFESSGQCTRCQMICIDQKTGTTTKEPLLTLSREFKGKVSFGIYLNYKSEWTEDKLIRPTSNIIVI